MTFSTLKCGRQSVKSLADAAGFGDDVAAALPLVASDLNVPAFGVKMTWPDAYSYTPQWNFASAALLVKPVSSAKLEMRTLGFRTALLGSCGEIGREVGNGV